MPVQIYTTLDDPLASQALGTQPYGINDAGQIVGLYDSSLPPLPLHLHRPPPVVPRLPLKWRHIHHPR